MINFLRRIQWWLVVWASRDMARSSGQAVLVRVRTDDQGRIWPVSVSFSGRREHP